MHAQTKDLTPIKGIRYYYPPDDAVLVFKDEKERIHYGGMPVPLLEDDFARLDGEPSYDEVGRGVYQALRSNPDCILCDKYAALLRDAYPHYLAELASNAIMIDSKDVEVPYLDRKIACLKVLALLEPQNPALPLEIGRVFLDRGMRLSALHLSTVSIYRAEHFLNRAHTLAPDDRNINRYLGEAYYLLGKYDEAVGFWRKATTTDEPEAERLRERIERISAGNVPLIPPVDYLEAIGAAFACNQTGEYEESIAILQDILMDPVFSEEFPIPEIHCVIGKGFTALDMPKYAEAEFRQALVMDPAHEEARALLATIAAA
ncbi:TPR domain-containing protein [Geobacter metallireducens RCH3]|uniref:Uncharacterized protein n=1 Tax=Geobacter metallireducens (strain ATCC 53774 / DSM 7210 / GS-15) TaxID=269799 RepID=Q39UV2_GEOMG|nr:hypothetical protein [Geobacter metallireducens]ABB31972.1 hypothetical protein Gmet_1741 [Geobacter metallireducens GS-15]EHP86317.1 TPR domain-containing protein [Geobacter metallireducens RCH3]